MEKEIVQLKTALDSLTVYRTLVKDPVISKLYCLVEGICFNRDFSELINCYGEFYYTFVENNPMNSLKNYIISSILYQDNAFSRCCETVEFDFISKQLIEAVKNDLRCLEKVANITSKSIKEAMKKKYEKDCFEYDAISSLPEWDFDSNHIKEDNDIGDIFKTRNGWAECVKFLHNFHRKNGSGDFARFKGFIWERSEQGGFLKGVESPDPIRFSDLIGYESERQIVIENTLKFLNGYPANNLLLYGDRGTGKSSTVKALLNEYGHLGLRIIEMPKRYLSDFYHVLRIIKDRPQKFVVFIDDLAFEDSEEDYTALKAVLEGGLENKPDNLVIYATSNRKHLIKEKFSDRAGLMYGDKDDEVRASDTLQEKLSLADRFGITITFSSPGKQKYLEIVDGLAERRGLNIDKDILHREALKWEMWHNGLSPRTARQFIDWIEGDYKK